jgi:biopolymer transport protein ExbB
MNQSPLSRCLALAMLLVLLVPFLSLCTTSFGQDDLTLPGDEAPVTAPSASNATDGGAQTEAITLWGRIKQGGWAMWPLAAMSIAVIALTVFLFMDLTPKNFHPEELTNTLQNAMDEGDFERAMTTAEASPTCLGQIIYGATSFIADRGYEVLDGDTIYDLMADAGQDFNRKRARTINYLSVISQAAPMLGLLGTVSGMIKAFATLGTGGLGDPKILAGNISEALMTTASGLVIALPAIFLYYFFRDRLTELVGGCDRHSSRMLTSLRRIVYSTAEHHYEHAEGAVEQPEDLPPPPTH